MLRRVKNLLFYDRIIICHLGDILKTLLKNDAKCCWLRKLFEKAQFWSMMALKINLRGGPLKIDESFY